MNLLSQHGVNIPDKYILESYCLKSLGVVAAVVEVDKKLAGSLLELLPENQRNVSRTNISKMQESLEVGAWNESNCDPIRFDTNGSLIDGQHRLLMMQGVHQKVKFVFIVGCSTNAIATIDTGKARSLSDVLKINGYTNCNKVAACLNLIVAYNRDGYIDKKSACVSECLAFLKKNTKRVYDAARMGDKAALYIPASVAGFLYYEYAKINQQGAEMMMKEFQISTGRCNAIDKLKTLMAELRNSKRRNHSRGIQVSKTWMTAVSIKAFNAYFMGDNIGVLRWIAKEDMPEINAIWME